jgi:hypothetical protein
MKNVIRLIMPMKINKKETSKQQFIPLPEAEIQGLPDPAQANLGYILAWFHCLQLLSSQPESPLASKCHVPFKGYVLKNVRK